MKKMFLIAFFIFVIGLSCSAFAATIISTFDVDAEGWTVWVGEGAITYQATGGNPGGYLSIQDIGSSSYVVYPPSKFKGNLSEFNGGLLSYDIIVIYPTTQQVNIGGGFGRIQLGGGGSNATFSYLPEPPIPSPTNWMTYYVPMTADAWQTTQENWERVLSNVTYFDIVLDYTSGEDKIGFDNFAMTSNPIPEPSSLFLLGTGLLGLLKLRRRK